MRELLMTALLLALSVGALAQVSSNGPVIADYGKHVTATDPTPQNLKR